MRSQLVSVPGSSIEVLEGGAGPSIVVTHPFGTVSTENSMLAGALVSLGHVLAVNGRGQGRSDPAADRAQLSRRQLADDLEHLRRASGIRQWVVAGESAGGFVALDYALRYPEAVSALLLVSTAAGFDCFADPESIYHPSHPDHDLVRPTDGAAKHEERLWPAIAGRPERVRMWAAKAAGVAGERLAVHRADPCSYQAQLGDITCPALVLTGAKDGSIPSRWGKALAAGLADAELVVFPDSGHFPYWEEPELFQEVVAEFLSGMAPGA